MTTGTEIQFTERQKRILAYIIRDYVETAQAVGSQRLVEVYHVDASSATVRNEMVFLTQKGYLKQPHTSAGRIPTENGFRYFVRQLMGQAELPVTVQRMITHQFHQSHGDIESWMRLSVSVLANQSQSAALVTAPHPHQSLKTKIRHLSLISTSGRQVLMVLVLMGGEVKQQMLYLAEPMLQEQLSNSAKRLTALFEGFDVNAIRFQMPTLDTLEQDIIKLILEELEQSNKFLGGEIYRDGLANILSEPEFAETGAARRALRILEERPLLEDLLSRSITTTKVGGVQVIIGGEGAWKELSECSMVLARYGIPDILSGILGVLGPIRMPYSQTISSVRFVAGVLSDLVTDIYAEQE